MNYSRITSEADMVTKNASGVISLSGRVPEELQNPPELGLMMTAASELFRGIVLGYLWFSRGVE